MTRLATLALAVLALPPTGPTAAEQGVFPESAVAVLPSGAEFTLEIAADPVSHARGYMYREHVGPREGMLFLFERDERRPFWMKNCKVPLDIVWLDSELRVVYIAHAQPPCPDEGECVPVQPMRLARHVVQFAGGTARTLGLKIGDRIEVLSEPPLF